jgi:lysophospholipase L1-like esterase
MHVPIVDKFYGIQQIREWQALLSEDGVHPTDSGYRVIAQQEAPVVSKLVSAILGE